MILPLDERPINGLQIEADGDFVGADLYGRRMRPAGADD